MSTLEPGDPHSMGELADALAAMTRNGQALRLAFGPATRASRPYAQLRSDYRAVLAAGGQPGKFAPSRESPPADPAARRREILDTWAGTNTRLSARVRSWPEGAAETARIKHPLLGPLTVREMAAFTVYYTVHHLTLVRDRLEIN